jgi:hypothetical protein
VLRVVLQNGHTAQVSREKNGHPIAGTLIDDQVLQHLSVNETNVFKTITMSRRELTIYIDRIPPKTPHVHKD